MIVNVLQLYGYLDPMGFSVLTRAERISVEKELVLAFKKGFESPASVPPSSSSAAVAAAATATATATSSAQRQTTTKSNNVDKAWQGFLKSINKDLTTEIPSTTTIQDEIRNYRNLATKL